MIRPRRTVASDSRWRGVRPAHEHKLLGAREACDVPDLGRKESAEDGSHRERRPRSFMASEMGASVLWTVIALQTFSTG